MAAPNHTAPGVAVESDTEVLVTDGAVYVNPIYDDVITEEDITIPDVEEAGSSADNDGISTASDDEEIVYCTTVEEAGAILRAGMKAREESITVYYYGEAYVSGSDYFKELCTENIIPEALVETENADEGDYLRYNYGGTGYRASIKQDSNGELRYYTIYFTPTYFTTAEQEAEMTTTVDTLLAGALAFSEDTDDYDKLYTVYDYICSNVTYDNDNLSDSTYTLKYTAYAALINGTAVCQGYATLYYRLLRELGLSVRVATGYGGVVSEDTSDYYENHAWNIVQIEGKWYYADSTWDASFSDEVAVGTYTYQYFLRGTSDFDDLASPYTTTGIHYLMMDSSFTDAYAIEETRYHHYVAVVTAPTCTEDGYTTYTCTLCGESYVGDETEAYGHTWDEGTVTKEATTTEEGVITYTCTVCGETKTEAIAVKKISVPSVTLCASQNGEKIRLTGTITDYENISDYYTVTGHGFVYITKAKLGAKSLSINTSGRTKVTINGIGDTGAYSYSMTPKTSSTVYVIRAWVSYTNSSGKTVYVYSDPIYVSYNNLASQ
ncbi:MAG: hypothetical protein LUC30_02445 [Clostridiales bacterium]|nr:hypothetical protein [Clostridiales bacterium]